MRRKRNNTTRRAAWIFFVVTTSNIEIDLTLLFTDFAHVGKLLDGIDD